jgi:hypothetical protein
MNYGLILPYTEVWYIGAAATTEADNAAAGKPLSDYRGGQDFSRMLAAPTNNIGAYYKAGYWLAIASRILGDRALASDAKSLVNSATLRAALPATSQLTGDVYQIYQSAGQKLAPYTGNKQIAAISGILGVATSGGIATRQAAMSDQRIILRTGEAAAGDVASGAQKIRNIGESAFAFFSNTRSPGMSDSEWLWHRTKWWAGIVGAIGVVIGVGYTYRPYAEAYVKGPKLKNPSGVRRGVRKSRKL